MIDFRLPLFPVDNTASAVTMTVWIGVAVVVFFNLRFGWTLSGLVVPGYLVPLLFVKPTSVAVIVFEAIVTYLIARALSDGGARLPFWSSFFGRDRFFAIVLVSVLVRAAADGWLLPAFGQWLNTTYGFEIDYRNDLHSYGLIVVALLANYFWKPGVWHGLVTSGVSVGLTYGLLDFFVLRYTNFSLGSLHYMYEDVSASLLASPKSYVIVITTAYIASWLNLRYAWDFNGILIPALLGLLWHDPMKIAVTLVESLWILALASLTLRLPIWKQVTVEGGRKLLLFFSLAALHRLALAHLLPMLGDFHVTDSYGFGYLLTSLLAMKAHDKGIPLRVLRATVQTSMLGAVAGSMLGFLLSHVPASPFAYSTTRLNQINYESHLSDLTSLAAVVRQCRLQLYRTRVPESYQAPIADDLQHFRNALHACRQFTTDPSPSQLERIRLAVRPIQYRVAYVEGRYLVLLETEPYRGWGTYIVDCANPKGLLIEVPFPLDEWGTVESAVAALNMLEGHALAISGTSRRANADRSSDMLANRMTLMHEFHKQFANQNVLQIRGWTASLADAGPGDQARAADETANDLPSALYVKRSLPHELKLSALKSIVPNFDVYWENISNPNAFRTLTPRGFGELVLSRHDRRRLLHRALSDTGRPSTQLSLQTGHLEHWLRRQQDLMARAGSNRYVPPLVEELVFLDEEVVRPLIHLAITARSFSELTSEQLEQVTSVATTAAVFGYELLPFHDMSSGDDFFILSESEPRERHWGSVVLRIGSTSSYVVEVPRPFFERQTYEFGTSLYARLRAQVLILAGAHPHANSDGTADVTRLVNKVNFALLTRQVLLREQLYAPLLLIQIRAIQAPVNADVVVATHDGTTNRESMSPQVRAVLDQLEADDLRLGISDGSEAYAGYELGILLQAASLNHSVNKQMLNLWLSPLLRRQYRDSSEQKLATAQFDALGIETYHVDLLEFVLTQSSATPAEWRSWNINDQLLEITRNYLRNGDIVHLDRLLKCDSSLQVSRVVDVATDQAFLVIRPDATTCPLIVNLDGWLSEQATVVTSFAPEALNQFRYTRQQIFLMENRP